MEHHESIQPDYGMGQKKLGIYLIGFISSSLLTLLSFWAVMSGIFSQWGIYSIIFSSAIIQLFVQIICFLRLNTQTQPGKMNVMSFVFTIVVLLTLVAGSLWIMWSLHYYMMN